MLPFGVRYSIIDSCISRRRSTDDSILDLVRGFNSGAVWLTQITILSLAISVSSPVDDSFGCRLLKKCSTHLPLDGFVSIAGTTALLKRSSIWSCWHFLRKRTWMLGFSPIHPRTMFSVHLGPLLGAHESKQGTLPFNQWLGDVGSELPSPKKAASQG